MKNFFFLTVIIVFHLILSKTNAQTGWYQQFSGTDQYLLGVYFTDVNTGTVVGTFDTILRTTDGGKTWVAQNSGTTNLHFFDVTFIDSNTGVAVGIGGTILRTTNGGETWTSQISGIVPAIFSVYFADENNGTAVGHTGIILRTTDRGITWSPLPDAPTTLRAVHFADVNNGFTVGDNGLIMRTTDGGANWFIQPGGIQVNLLGVYFTDTNTGTVVGGSNLTGARIYRTTDGGITWMLQYSIPNEVLSDVHFTDSQTGTAVGWNGTILRTTNSGEDWFNQKSNSTSFFTSVFFVNSKIGFTVGSSGTIQATLDGGIPVELVSFSANVQEDDVTLNWATASEINNKGFEIERLQNNNITKLHDWEKIGFLEGKGTTTELNAYSFSDKNLPAGKYIYRLKQIDFDGTFEYSNEIEVEINLLSVFKLEQNFPNPFNPETVIYWELPVSSTVSVKVFNVIGEEIAELVKGNFDAGRNSVKFSAENLNSGIYFYTLETEGTDGSKFTSAKKMIVLK